VAFFSHAIPVRPQLSISDVLIGERSYSTPTSVLSQVSPQSPSLVGTPSSRVITQNDFVVRDSPLTRSRCDLTDTRVATRIHTKARLANSDTTTTLVSFLFSVVTCDSLFPFLSFQRSIPRSGSICVYKNHVRSVTRIHASSGAKPLEGTSTQSVSFALKASYLISLQSTAVTYCGSCGHTAEHFSSSRYDGLSGNGTDALTTCKQCS